MPKLIYDSLSDSLNELLKDQPWKAFNSYKRAVNSVVVHSSSLQGVKAKPLPYSQPSLAELDLGFVSEAQAMFEALPEREKAGASYQHCWGLPRKYPRFWMARAHSNSLSFEYREVQSLPSNGLKSWKD